MHSTRIPLAAATALVAGLALSGCFFNPVEAIVDRTLEENGVDIDKDGGEITWQTDDGEVTATTGDDVALPGDFPSDVPKPDGKLTGVVESEGTLATNWEQVSREEVDRLAGELTKAGYAETTLTSTAEGYMGAFDTDSRTVTVIWSSGDASGGALIYGITAKQ